MSTGTKLATYWDWKAGAEVPDARIVVCAHSDEPGRIQPIWPSSVRGRRFVHTRAWNGTERPPEFLIPALHVTRQADLARLPALLAVRAERRALVVTPGEAIDLVAGGALGCDCPDDERCWGICAFYRSWPLGVAKRRIDAVFIFGGDAPIHPDWVRSIVEQCRKAGVPVILVTWGEWVPREHLDPVWWLKEGDERRVLGGEDFRRVGAERSGALLDGQPIEDVPAWMGGAHG